MRGSRPAARRQVGRRRARAPPARGDPRRSQSHGPRGASPSDLPNRAPEPPGRRRDTRRARTCRPADSSTRTVRRPGFAHGCGRPTWAARTRALRRPASRRTELVPPGSGRRRSRPRTPRRSRCAAARRSDRRESRGGTAWPPPGPTSASAVVRVSVERSGGSRSTLCARGGRRAAARQVLRCETPRLG